MSPAQVRQLMQKELAAEGERQVEVQYLSLARFTSRKGIPSHMTLCRFGKAVNRTGGRFGAYRTGGSSALHDFPLERRS